MTSARKATMIGNRTQRLIGRTVVTAAIVATMAVLIVMFIRSGGHGTGAGTVLLRARTSRSGEHSGQGAGGEAAGSSGQHGGEAANGGETSAAKGGPPSVENGGPPTVAATGTYTGSTVETSYGPVQVALVEQNGRITDVKALQLPTEHAQSAYISERAAPLLREEALQAQSARINIVSGATFTSEAYAESLQQALSHVH